MNNTQAIDINIIRDTVMSAQEAISEVLTPLQDTDDAACFANASDDICAHLENIGVIADMSCLKGLNAVCVQYGNQLLDLPLFSIHDKQLVHEQLNNWLFNILLYLDDCQSLENIELLTASLAENADNIHHLLLNDAQHSLNIPIEQDAISTQENTPVKSDEDLQDETSVASTIEVNADNNEIQDVDNDDIIDNINPDSPEGIMSLFCHELRDLQPHFIELTQQLIDNEIAASAEAASTYMNIIERIHLTCDELNLSGIVRVCEFILKNINLSLEFGTDSRSRIKDVLEGWPQVIIDHLQSPSDDKLCLAVVEYLENDSWPEPLKYSETRDLIDDLTKELELTGDYEVEARSIEATEDDVLLQISEDTSQQLHDAFFSESPTHAEELTTHIADIIIGNNVLEHTKAAQRISHTLKGSANLIGVNGIANLAHHLEDIFEYLAKQSLPPPEPLAYTMQEAADTIEIMIESLQGLVAAPVDAQRILQDVLNWANRIDQGNLTRETDIRLESQSADVDNINTSDAQASITSQAENKALTQTELLRVPRDTIDQIFNLIGETSIAIGQIQEQLKRMHERGDEMRKQEKTLQSRRFELENLVSIRGMANQQKRQIAASGDGKFDSLEMDRYDEFYGATHTFIEAVSDTREASRDVSAHIIELDGLFLKQQRLNRALQDLVMTTRMVSVKTIVSRLQRTVRQACRSTGKQVELEITGDALLMDGDVLNQLADPLMHLLRNAIDHGIEMPEVRLSKGKENYGHINLHFYQQGNSINIDCSDDGAGLDYERIRWTALEQDLISPKDEIDNSELARMILSSGFSTRDKATQISGRGVGMDVVNTAILSLKGSIDISDNQAGGTRFNLRLPITLLTSHSIIVQTEGGRYAIPTSMLEQILPPGTGQYSRLNDNLTFQLGKDVYPARSLAELLGLAAPERTKNNAGNTVMLVRYDTEVYAVTVEYVVSSYDLVVKSLGRYVKSVPGITGVALLGDGGVVPVLDITGLLDLQQSDSHKITHTRRNTIAEKTQLAKVLIVDDSLSVRKSLSQLVQDAGYEAIVVRDGIEALEVMQKTTPDLILTDLEMPRMNGLELASHVRSDPDTGKLPIMMITSRTMSKHQIQAQKVGINEYITKPFSEDELIEKLGVALHG